MEAKKYFLLLCFAIFHIAAIAQNNNCNYTLTGKVSDEHDSSPLAFSYIVHMETDQIVTADLDGNYKINNLCSGLNHFIISHIGCESDTVAVQIDQQSQVQNFQLEHHAKELATVWIEENKKNLHTLSGTDIDNYRDGLIAEMMEKIPGVNSIKTGSNFSIPVVHGMSGNRLSIINNGIPLLYQQWGSEHSPEIDPYTINEISLISGTEALRYSAGNIGGALLASTSKMPIDTGIHGKVHAGFGNNKRMGKLAGILEGRTGFLPNLSWRVNASGKKSGNTKTPDYYLDNTGIEELNYSADLKYEFKSSKLEIGHSSFFNKIGIFPGSHISDLTELQHLTEEEKPDEEFTKGFSYKISEPFQQAEHQSSFLKYEVNVNNRNKLNLSFSRQNNKRSEYESHDQHDHEEHGHEEHEDEIGTASIYHLKSYHGAANWRITSLKNHLTEFGIQAIVADNEVRGENKFIPTYSSNTYSAYGLRKWYMNRFTWDAGFRFDHKAFEIELHDRPMLEETFQSFNSLSISSGIEFSLNKNQDIKINLSLAQRAPNINELYSKGVHHGTASIENGNSKLLNESNNEINISYSLRKEKLWFNLFLYNKYIRDYIYLDYLGTDSTEHGIFQEYSWKQNDANFMGADLFLRYSILRNLNIDFEASYLQAVKTEDSKHLTFIPANSAKSTLMYSFENGDKFQKQYIRISMEYIAKQKQLPENFIFDSPSAYTLLSAGMGSALKFDNKELRLSLEVNNLLNRKYRDYLDRFRYFSDAMGRNFRLRLAYDF